MVHFQIQPAPALHAGRTVPDKDAQPDPSMLPAHYPLDGGGGPYAGVEGGYPRLD